jgi:hypothetical protein
MVNAEHLARNRTAAANYLENEFNKPPSSSMFLNTLAPAFPNNPYSYTTKKFPNSLPINDLTIRKLEEKNNENADGKYSIVIHL